MIEVLAPFTASVLALMAVPGPDMAILVSNGVAHGRRGAFYTALGISLGGMVWAISVALVVTATSLHIRLLAGLQFLGCLYLLWLAFAAIHRPHASPRARVEPSTGNLVARGAATNLSNPKAAVFFGAFIPQFIPDGAASPELYAFGLGSLLCAIGLIINTSIGIAGSTLGFLDEIGPLGRAWSQWILALTFLAVGLLFLVP